MSTTGTWNIGGYNLPDYSVTEKLGNLFGYQGSTQPTTFYNPQAGVTGQIGPAVYAEPVIGPTYSGPQTQTQTYTQPQQTQQSSGGGNVPYGGTFNGQVVNYNGSQYRWNGSSWVNEGSNAQRAQSEAGQYDPMIDQIYNPQKEYLNTLEKQYQNQLPTTLQNVQTGYDTGIAQVGQQQTEQRQALDTQGQNIEQGKASALANARQLYNELSQRNQAMFGGRSSAGQFSQELLGRQTTKGFGDIEQSAQNSQRQIAAEHTKLLNWVSDKKIELQKSKAEATTSVTNQFNTAMASIASNRSLLEGAKAQARLQVLQEAQASIKQIAAADKSFSDQIAMYEYQQAQSLKNRYAAPSGIDTGFLNATGKISDILNQYGPQAAQDVAKQSGTAFSFKAPTGYRYVQGANGWVLEKEKTSWF